MVTNIYEPAFTPPSYLTTLLRISFSLCSRTRGKPECAALCATRSAEEGLFHLRSRVCRAKPEISGRHSQARKKRKVDVDNKFAEKGVLFCNLRTTNQR